MYICLLANHLFLLSLAVLGLHCRTDFSAVVASEGFSCCHRASHCSGLFCGAEPPGLRGLRSFGRWAQQLRYLGSRAQIQYLWHVDLLSSTARGVFQDQGSNSCFLHWRVDSLPLSHQGSP